MMGAGGLAGNLLTSAVVSGITSAASEATWDTVNSDGSRLAKNVAKNLGQFFVIQGWDLTGGAAIGSIVYRPGRAPSATEHAPNMRKPPP